jgi:hypothetical protein
VRVFDRTIRGGRTSILILGAAHYPDAQVEKAKVPRLPDIASAAKSCIDFATRCITDWQDAFIRPIGTIDLLVNDSANPDGIVFTPPGEAPIQVEAPTLAAIKAARKKWMEDAGPDDLLLFYCCGHGVWLPSVSRTFLCADFGMDDEEPWSSAIALDDFQLALGDYAPRAQWLLFDCCANTPTVALEAIRARANPLLQPQAGFRGTMEQLHGPLAQVSVASASPGALAFGKPGRTSRFMEALLDAFDHAGFAAQDDDGHWWLDQAGLEKAMGSYAVRVAPVEEEGYFTFARLTQTDAPETPRLLGRAFPSDCTFLVFSEPAQRLKLCNLAIWTGTPAQLVVSQTAGPNALTRFKHDVPPFLNYNIEADFPEGRQVHPRIALPPVAKARFV